MDYIDWIKMNRRDFKRALENAEAQKKQFLDHIKNVLNPDIEQYTNYLEQSDATISVLEVLNGYKPQKEEENLG